MISKLKKRKRKKELEEIKKKIENIDEEVKKSKFEKYLVSIFYLLPPPYQKKIEEEATFANVGNYQYYFTKIFLISFILPQIFPLYLLYLHIPWMWAAALEVVFLSMATFLPYFSLILAADSRSKRLEKYLPDFLILFSSNIKSGLTIDKAILFASRKEFGELSDITRRAAYEIYGGKDIGDALKDMSKHIKSEIFHKTIYLLLQGLRSGGNIAKLLEEAANDIRNTEMLQKEIKSTVVTYIMFIFFAGVIASPLLFATSVFLIQSTTSMWKVDVSMSSLLKEYGVMSFISINKPHVDIQMFQNFSIAALIITTIFAGLLISVIHSGNYKSALKYSPIFMVLSIAIYYGAYYLLSYLFGGMLT